jgi:hypothetical protein
MVWIRPQGISTIVAAAELSLVSRPESMGRAGNIKKARQILSLPPYFSRVSKG